MPWPTETSGDQREVGRETARTRRWWRPKGQIAFSYEEDLIHLFAQPRPFLGPMNAARSADRSSVWVFCGSFSAWIREQEKRIMSGNRIKDISDRRVKLWSGEWMIKHNHKSQPDEMKPLSHQLGLCWEGIYTSFGLTEGVIVGLYNLIRSHWKSKILIKIKKYLPI